MKEGSRVLINAQLVRVADDRNLWAQSYQRELVDILGLFQEVSNQIAQKVSANLADSPPRPEGRHREVNPEAWDDYIRGLYFKGRWSGPNLHKALEFFQKSIDEDPGFAPAHVGLAFCYAGLVFVHALPQREAYARSRQAAVKALQLDGTNADAWSALGAAKLFEWDWAGAEAATSRAMELNPTLAVAQDASSYFFMAMGRHDESVEAMKRAVELDPVSSYTNLHLAWALYNAGRYDEAIEHLRSTADLYPERLSGWFLAQNYIEKAMYGEAEAELNCAELPSPAAAGADSRRRLFQTFTSCQRVFALAGRGQAARKALSELLEEGLSFRRFYIAQAFAALGEDDLAFGQLERAFEERDSDLVFIRSEPGLKSLRPDPRFDELLRRMGLKP